VINIESDFVALGVAKLYDKRNPGSTAPRGAIGQHIANPPTSDEGATPDCAHETI